MSTNAEEIRVQEFAQMCMNALRRIKESFPKTWKEKLAPFRDEIKTLALEKKITDSAALDLILNKLTKESDDREKLKTTLTFYMAAYSLLL